MDLHVNVLAKQEQRKRHHDVHSHVGSFQMHQMVVVWNFPVSPSWVPGVLVELSHSHLWCSYPTGHCRIGMLIASRLWVKKHLNIKESQSFSIWVFIMSSSNETTRGLWVEDTPPVGYIKKLREWFKLWYFLATVAHRLNPLMYSQWSLIICIVHLGFLFPKTTGSLYYNGGGVQCTSLTIYIRTYLMCLLLVLITYQ